jgi:hypothetical protein
LQQIAKSIRTVEYMNIKKQIIQDFLTPKHSSILDYLRQTNADIDPSFTHRIPNMFFDQRNNSDIVTIVGFQEHQNQFKEILKRIQLLLNIIQSAKDFYQRHLNRTMRSITKNILSLVTSRTQIWREYKQLFIRLFQEKNTEYKQLFDEYIDEKLKSLIDSCILDQLVRPWDKIRKETDQFLEDHLFTDEIDLLKQKALDEFIKENISLQHLKFKENFELILNIKVIKLNILILYQNC